METELFKQNPWWEDEFIQKTYKREKYLKKIKDNLESKEILFLTGLRRIGKTTIMKQTIKELLEVSTDGKFDLASELRAIADYAEKNSSLEEGMYNYDCPPGQSFYKYPDRPGGHCRKDPGSPGTQTKRQPMSGAELSRAYRDRKGVEHEEAARRRRLHTHGYEE